MEITLLFIEDYQGHSKIFGIFFQRRPSGDPLSIEKLQEVFFPQKTFRRPLFSFERMWEENFP